MTHLQELNALLSSSQFNPVWYEYRLDLAEKLLGQLDGHEWQELKMGWRGHAVEWQDLLADALSGGPQPLSTELLLEIVEIAPDVVAKTAAESLRVLPPPSSGYRVSDHVVKRIERLFEVGEHDRSHPVFQELVPFLLPSSAPR